MNTTTPSDVLATELAVSAAADHARAGDHHEALRLLARADQDDPTRLDLLARVHAQRGDLDAADAAWARLLELDPAHRGALAGRRLIARIRAGKARKRPVPTALWAAAGLAVLAAGTAVAWPSQPAEARDDAHTVVQDRPNDPRVQQWQADLDRSREQAEQRRKSVDALTGALGSPTATAVTKDDGTHITFTDGLFRPDGAALTPEGRQLLREWATRLAGRNVTVKVLGHGAPVPGGPTSGGSPVAIARATTAARALSESSGLPLTAFTTATADQSAAPHPGGTPEQNRTVTLVVAPA